jgi:hypothetical protein
MLRAFPFRTFDEIAAFGLEVPIYCGGCCRYVGPIDLTDDRLRGRLFAGVTSLGTDSLWRSQSPKGCCANDAAGRARSSR